MEDIEYLEEYEDLILPTIKSNSGQVSFSARSGNNNTTNMIHDEDSSSIDQDIFESLFDDHSDDESVLQKKVDPKLSQRRQDDRVSLDSLDMLVKDLVDDQPKKNTNFNASTSGSVSKVSTQQTKKLTSTLNTQTAAARSSQKASSTSTPTQILKKRSAPSTKTSNTTHSSKSQTTGRLSIHNQFPKRASTTETTMLANKQKSKSISANNPFRQDATKFDKSKSVATIKPSVQQQHQQQNRASPSQANRAMGSASSSKPSSSPAPMPAKKQISTSQKKKTVTQPVARRPVPRPPTTIVKPEKREIKDPSEDPLSLDDIAEALLDSDSESFSLSDISDDTLDSLSDFDDDSYNVIDISNDSSIDGKSNHGDLDNVRAETPSPTVSDDREDITSSPSPPHLVTKSHEINDIQQNLDSLLDDSEVTPSTSIKRRPEKITIISDTLLSRIDTALLAKAVVDAPLNKMIEETDTAALPSEEVSSSAGISNNKLVSSTDDISKEIVLSHDDIIDEYNDTADIIEETIIEHEEIAEEEIKDLFTQKIPSVSIVTENIETADKNESDTFLDLHFGDATVNDQQKENIEVAMEVEIETNEEAENPTQLEHNADNTIYEDAGVKDLIEECHEEVNAALEEANITENTEVKAETNRIENIGEHKKSKRLVRKRKAGSVTSTSSTECTGTSKKPFKEPLTSCDNMKSKDSVVESNLLNKRSIQHVELVETTGTTSPNVPVKKAKLEDGTKTTLQNAEASDKVIDTNEEIFENLPVPSVDTQPALVEVKSNGASESVNKCTPEHPKELETSTDTKIKEVDNVGISETNTESKPKSSTNISKNVEIDQTAEKVENTDTIVEKTQKNKEKQGKATISQKEKGSSTSMLRKSSRSRSSQASDSNDAEHETQVKNVKELQPKEKYEFESTPKKTDNISTKDISKADEPLKVENNTMVSKDTGDTSTLIVKTSSKSPLTTETRTKDSDVKTPTKMLLKLKRVEEKYFNKLILEETQEPTISSTVSEGHEEHSKSAEEETQTNNSTEKKVIEAASSAKKIVTKEDHGIKETTKTNESESNEIEMDQQKVLNIDAKGTLKVENDGNDGNAVSEKSGIAVKDDVIEVINKANKKDSAAKNTDEESKHATETKEAKPFGTADSTEIRRLELTKGKTLTDIKTMTRGTSKTKEADKDKSGGNDTSQPSKEKEIRVSEQKNELAAKSAPNPKETSVRSDDTNKLNEVHSSDKKVEISTKDKKASQQRNIIPKTKSSLVGCSTDKKETKEIIKNEIENKTSLKESSNADKNKKGAKAARKVDSIANKGHSGENTVTDQKNKTEKINSNKKTTNSNTEKDKSTEVKGVKSENNNTEVEIANKQKSTSAVDKAHVNQDESNIQTSKSTITKRNDVDKGISKQVEKTVGSVSTRAITASPLQTRKSIRTAIETIEEKQNISMTTKKSENTTQKRKSEITDSAAGHSHATRKQIKLKDEHSTMTSSPLTVKKTIAIRKQDVDNKKPGNKPEEKLVEGTKNPQKAIPSTSTTKADEEKLSVADTDSIKSKNTSPVKSSFIVRRNYKNQAISQRPEEFAHAILTKSRLSFKEWQQSKNNSNTEQPIDSNSMLDTTQDKKRASLPANTKEKQITKTEKSVEKNIAKEKTKSDLQTETAPNAKLLNVSEVGGAPTLNVSKSKSLPDLPKNTVVKKPDKSIKKSQTLNKSLSDDFSKGTSNKKSDKSIKLIENKLQPTTSLKTQNAKGSKETIVPEASCTKKETSIDKKETSIDKKATSIDKKETSIDKKEASIDKKETSIDKKETSIDKKETSIDKKETSIAKKETSIDKKETSIDKKETSIDKKEASIDKKETSIDKKETSIDKKETSIDKKETSIDKKEASIDKKETSIDKKETSIDKKETSIDKKETSIDKKETSIDKKETSIDKKEASIDKKETSIDKKETSIDKKETSIDKKETSIDKKETSIDKKETSIDKKETSIDKKESSIDKKETSKDKKEILIDKEESLSLKKVAPIKKGSLSDKNETLTANQGLSSDKVIVMDKKESISDKEISLSGKEKATDDKRKTLSDKKEIFSDKGAKQKTSLDDEKKLSNVQIETISNEKDTLSSKKETFNIEKETLNDKKETLSCEKVIFSVNKVSPVHNKETSSGTKVILSDKKINLSGKKEKLIEKKITMSGKKQILSVKKETQIIPMGSPSKKHESLNDKKETLIDNNKNISERNETYDAKKDDLTSKQEIISDKKKILNEKKEISSSKKEILKEKKEIANSANESLSEKKESGSEKKESGSGKNETSSSRNEIESDKKETLSDKKETLGLMKETSISNKETSSDKKETLSDKKESLGNEIKTLSSKKEELSDKKEIISDNIEISSDKKDDLHFKNAALVAKNETLGDIKIIPSDKNDDLNEKKKSVQMEVKESLVEKEKIKRKRVTTKIKQICTKNINENETQKIGTEKIEATKEEAKSNICNETSSKDDQDSSIKNTPKIASTNKGTTDMESIDKALKENTSETSNEQKQSLENDELKTDADKNLAFVIADDKCSNKQNENSVKKSVTTEIKCEENLKPDVENTTNTLEQTKDSNIEISVKSSETAMNTEHQTIPDEKSMMKNNTLTNENVGNTTASQEDLSNEFVSNSPSPKRKVAKRIKSEIEILMASLPKGLENLRHDITKKRERVPPRRMKNSPLQDETKTSFSFKPPPGPVKALSMITTPIRNPFASDIALHRVTRSIGSAEQATTKLVPWKGRTIEGKTNTRMSSSRKPAQKINEDDISFTSKVISAKTNVILDKNPKEMVDNTAKIHSQDKKYKTIAENSATPSIIEKSVEVPKKTVEDPAKKSASETFGNTSKPTPEVYSKERSNVVGSRMKNRTSTKKSDLGAISEHTFKFRKLRVLLNRSIVRKYWMNLQKSKSTVTNSKIGTKSSVESVRSGIKSRTPTEQANSLASMLLKALNAPSIPPPIPSPSLKPYAIPNITVKSKPLPESETSLNAQKAQSIIATRAKASLSPPKSHSQSLLAAKTKQTLQTLVNANNDTTSKNTDVPCDDSSLLTPLKTANPALTVSQQTQQQQPQQQKRSARLIQKHITQQSTPDVPTPAPSPAPSPAPTPTPTQPAKQQLAPTTSAEPQQYQTPFLPIEPKKEFEDEQSSTTVASQSLPNLVSGGLPAEVVDNSGTRLYSFLHPAKYNRSHGAVLLDYCCPNLDGPMPAIDPTRDHSQVQTLVRELPAYIVMTTKVVTRADLEAKNNSIPASIRKKMEKLTSASSAAPTGYSPVAATATPTVTSAAPVVVPTGPPVPPFTTSITALQKQLPPTTTLTPKMAPTPIPILPTTISAETLPTLTPFSAMTSSNVGAVNIATNTLPTLRPKPDFHRYTSLRTNLRRFDTVLKRHSPRICVLTYPERQRIVESILSHTQLTPKDVENATLLLEDYCQQVINLGTPKALSTDATPTVNTATHTTAPTTPNTSSNLCSSVVPSPTVTDSSTVSAKQNLDKLHATDVKKSGAGAVLQRQVPIYDKDRNIIGYQMQVSPATGSKMSTRAGAKLIQSSTPPSANAGKRATVATPAIPLKQPVQESPRIFYTKPLQTSTPISTATTTSSQQSPIEAALRLGRNVTIRHIANKNATAQRLQTLPNMPSMNVSSGNLPKHLPKVTLGSASTTTHTSISTSFKPSSSVASSTQRITRHAAAGKTEQVVVITKNANGSLQTTANPDECILPDDERTAAELQEIKREHEDDLLTGGS